MAVTKIWPVKDSLSRLIEYAENPDKTSFENLDMILKYAKNEDKVIFEAGEQCYLVTSLNCRGDALDSMIRVQKHFNARGDNLAYHAYQSFKSGEVTPQKCHEIGVKLAEKIWGNRYQVVVATHTNCSHMHNHFVISAVSFRDGKKLDTGNNYWKRVLSPASDEICRSYGLGTLGNRGKAAPRVIYMDEKNGKKTPYRLMADALDTALKLATSMEDFKKYLYDLGYVFDFKNLRIRSRFSEKWVTLTKLEDTFDIDYSRDTIELTLDANQQDYYDGRLPYQYSYSDEMKSRREKNGVYKQQSPYEKYYFGNDTYDLNNLGNLIVFLLALTGWTAFLPPYKATRKPATPLSPEMKAWMRDESRKAEMYSKTAVIMARENLKTGEDGMNYLERVDIRIRELVRDRKKLYYQAAKEDNGEEKRFYLNQIDLINQQLKLYRYEKKCLVNLFERSGILKEMIENEIIMRREKRDREYKKEEPIVERVLEIKRPVQEEYYRYDEPKEEPRRRRDDWER